MVNRSSLNISSVRVLMSGWVVALFLFASVSFADPVQYTDSSFPSVDIAIGTEGVEFQITGTPTYSQILSGSGSLYKTETGTLTLSNGGSSFTGDVYINGGAIKITAALSGTNSALGAVQDNRTIYVNSGAELILANQDIFTTAHVANPIEFVVDGGTISNSGANYDYLTNVTLKNGAEIKATNGHGTWKAFKLHSVTVVRSDRDDRSPVTITTNGQTNATIAFGDISNVIEAGASSSTINVGEITSEDDSADNNSDLIISAIIANPVYKGSGSKKNATEIVKKGAGTMELTAANTISGKTTISAGKIKLSGEGTLGTGAVVNNATLEFAHTSDKVSSNAISGTGALLKTGTGVLELSGANTYTGKTTISAGTLKLSGSSMGTGAIDNNGILDFASSSNLTYSGVISGTGSVTKSGTGTLELKTVNSSFTGDFTINNGTVKVSLGSNADNRTKSALGASNVAGREVIINSGAILELAAQDVMCDAHSSTKLTFVVDGGQIKNSGANYNFLQNVTLKNGANIYASNGNASWEAYKIQNLRVERSGNATASAVSLTAASGDHNVFTFGAISSKITTTPVSIYVEDITSAAGSSDTVTDLLITAKIVNPNTDGKTKKAAPIVKSGAGTLELKNAGNTYSGNLTINEGRVKLTSGSSTNGRTASALGSGNTTGRTVTVNNGAILEFAAQDVIINAHSDTKLTIVADGGQIINTGANYNYLQHLVLRNGASLYASDGHATWKAFKLHNVTVERKSDNTAGAPVTFSADMTMPNATIAFGAKSDTLNAGTSVSTINVAEITSSDASINDNVSDLVISAIIADPLVNSNGTSKPSAIVKTGAGTMEFSAVNTYTGKTSISEGTLYLSTENAIASSMSIVNNADITANSSQTLNNLSSDENGYGTIDIAGNLTLNNDQQTKYIGSIKADTIEKTGSETLQIYTEADGLVEAQSFVVSSGRIDLKGYMAGSITIEDAVFSPGNSIGEATFTNDFILGSAMSILLMEIGGENPDQNDALFAGGDITLNDGLIYLALSSDSALVGGDTFVAVLSGSNSSTLADDPDFIDKYVRSYYFTDLEVIQLDGSYGEKYNGKFAIRGTLDPNAVPEPSTWALLLLGSAGLLYWRKRK
ncbi:MAG: autotransporter-associated beta strand repeat-containing protein [Thermoguttaceae bacterium]|nr:autotransporter-associated beta strand repeat-containing protein [Thermoguttaceae bacterium]